MALLKDMSIRGKIISALSFVIAPGLVIAISSVLFLNAVNSRISSLISTDYAKVKLAERINADILEMHRAQKNLILATTFDQVSRFKHHLSQYRADLESSLASIERLASEQEREPLKSFNTHFREFDKINDQILSLIEYDWQRFGDPADPNFAGNANNKKAVELSIGSGRAAFDRASGAISEIIKKTEGSMNQSSADSQHLTRLAMLITTGLSGFGIALGLLMGLITARFISSNINSLVSVTNAIAGGELTTPIEVNSADETGVLASSIGVMQRALLDSREADRQRDWLKTGITRINDVMRGKVQVSDLARDALSEVATYAGAHVGALFLWDEGGSEPVLKLAGGYAYRSSPHFPDRFKPGEGLVGQAALGKKQLLISDVPDDYVKVCSGLGDACPVCLTLNPLLYGDKVKGVIELGFVCPPSELHINYLEQVMPAIAINIETAQGREALAKALAHSQALYEELERQQEELKATNEELEEQTEALNKSHQRLRLQQEELEELNQELEEKNNDLDLQKRAIEQTNRELEQSRLEIEEKAQKLALANQYKSQFLANMSHELRTPLNSMLLLSRMLANNSEGNLSEDQVRSAEIIHGSGNDLLSLINEILDLAKIESGRMEMHVEAVPVSELVAGVLDRFQPLAEEKGLRLEAAMGAGCPDTILTDRKRTDQIIRNLVSNAVKFTEMGAITVSIGLPPEGGPYSKEDFLSISVADTGPGIPPEKQALVFEAFQQLEGGVSRRYGGTGLGLSISRELAHLLGGEIELVSQEGVGSTFSLMLPLRVKAAETVCHREVPPRVELKKQPVASPPSFRDIHDDRASIGNHDKSILIIEDDPRFAELLVKLCREKGFKCLFAPTGEEGLAMAGQHLPKGIILDIRLPGRDGWSVLEELKSAPETRHIPVHIMSVDDSSLEAFRKGAIGFLTKPAREEEVFDALRRLEDVFSRQVKDLLIVEDDRSLCESIRKLIGNNDVHADEATTARQAITAVKSKRYDCMILDLGLPDMSGLEMLRVLSSDPGIAIPPVIIYTGREITHEEEMELRAYSDSIIIKGVRSHERLLDEASLFLHRVIENLPSGKRRMITDLYRTDAAFEGKQVLIVDDDMRNVFALSSVLEEKGIKTFKAENGRKALDILDKNPGIHLVLLDIMMPVMDGYETMRHIRSREEWQKLPIIALTAKAMPKDRERCIASGASDYLSKPVDLDRLLSMMRVWLYR